MDLAVGGMQVFCRRSFPDLSTDIDGSTGSYASAAED
jgi:hypothetical protein